MPISCHLAAAKVKNPARPGPPVAPATPAESSVFNADMIDRVELMSGGFAAEHGGRVSSVLEIESDAGDGDFAVDAGISLLASRVAVAGLVLVRQRPGTAKGVIFITLEDETGISNVIVWRKMYERFRRAVIAGRALKVPGRVQREGGVTHVIAEVIEDISPMLDELLRAPAD